MNFEQFASLVKEKRLEAGLSQVELVRRISKKGSKARVQKIVSNLETGVGCDQITLQSICRVLQIKPVPKVDDPTGNRFRRAKPGEYLNPQVEEGDLRTLCGNESLREIVDSRISTIIKQECVKFRTALASLK